MAKSKKKSNIKKSKYDAAFFIRIGILLPVLLLFAGGLAYDRLVLVPHGEKKIAEIIATKNPSDGNAEALIQEKAGKSPAQKQTIGNFDVHEYRFGRILPNLAPHICTVVFSDGHLVETYAGTMPEEEISLLKTKPVTTSETGE